MLYSEIGKWIESVRQDSRYSFRALKRQRKVVAAAALTLALGIGASVTIFSVVRSVLLHTVELPRFEDLSYIYAIFPNHPRYAPGPLFPEQAQWLRRESKSFSCLALTSLPVSALVSGAGDPFNADGLWVTGDYFETLGTRPEIGRFIRPEDDVRGGEPVVVLSHHMWLARFGADRDVVGRRIDLNGKPHRIVGVAGREVSSLDDRRFAKQFWIPAAESEEPMAFTPIGRLRTGVSIQAANAELGALGARRSQEFPDEAGTSFTASPVAEVLLGETPRHLRALALAVGVLLLIACINVSGLLMTRVIGRRAEIALHMMLGASRFRLCRLIFFETLILSLLGATGGIVLTFACLRAIVALGSTTVPGLESVRVDGGALLFALATAAFAAAVSSAVPAAIALRASAVVNPQSARRGSTRSTVGRVGSLFISFQFAAGLILLAGAGILLNNFVRMLRMPAGFDPDRLVVMETSIPYGGLPRNSIFPNETLRRLRPLRGVRDVAFAEPGITLAGLHTSLRLPGQPETHRFLTPITSISPGFFRVMHIPVLEGRDFTEADTTSPVPPIIVNENVARRFWPNQSAVGMELIMPAETTLRKWVPSRVVGVVRTAPIYGVHYTIGSSLMQIYRPSSQHPGLIQFLIRTAEPASQIGPRLRQVVRDVESRQPVDSIATLQERIAEQVVPDRFYTYLLLTFSIIAVTIASAGLHGLLSYVVASRTHEIGIRIAVGASAVDLAALLSGFGLRAALAGVAIGLAGAYAATGLLKSLLYAVKANDPITFAAAAVTFSAVSVITCIAPLRTMLRVDPAAYLRCE